MPTEPPANVQLAREIWAAIGGDPSEPTEAEKAGHLFRASTRERLLDAARRLGLKAVTKLSKESLAEKVHRAYQSLHDAVVELTDAREEADASTFTAKFDLGPGVVDRGMPQSIPWGYGADRVTAMVVDALRLFIYWEVTDDAIQRARRTLGPGGDGAWLNVRVYDITGRLFDGTNAHAYFDEGVDRGVRQWFFEIGKPTSTACVEVGLKSAEGFFAKIARSGRVDFPRSAPEGGGPVEWLTVRTSAGYAGDPVVGGAPIPDGAGAAGNGHFGGDSANGWPGWTEGAGFPAPGAPPSFEHSWQWRDGRSESWHSELGRVEWTGPVQRSEWHAGPFAYPVEAPSQIEHHESGEISVRTRDGLVHVVYGPWQVVIRGVGARAERRVLATWQYRRTVAVQGGAERQDVEAADWWQPLAPGSSGWRMAGASERAWLGASELLFRGASELYMMGASERLLRGASERLYTGASERLFRGASERLFGGASERLFGGASENQPRGEAGRQVFPSTLGASENAPRGAGAPDASPYPRPES